MISNPICPACMMRRLAELESLDAAGKLEDFSAEEDELFRLRSCAKARTIDSGEFDAHVSTDDLEL